MTAIASVRPRISSERRRWLALVAVCLAQLMIVLDTTIVNVALPTIQGDLGFSQADLTWVINAYLITFGSLLLLAGRFGDLVGRKRVLLFGIVLFTFASALCGLAPSQATLIAGRALQGVGAASASSVVLALIVTGFPAGAERQRAMSIFTFVVVSGGSLGLVLGGILTEATSWHWIFFVNLPVGVLTFFMARALVEDNEGLGLENGVDVLGSVLVTLAMGVGVYAIVKASANGWGSAQTLGFGGASLALLAAFAAVETRIDNPIVPMAVVRIRSLVDSNVVRSFMVMGLFSSFFFWALFFQRVEHYTPLQTGLAFLPQTFVVAAMSLGPTEKLMKRFGAKRLLMAGLSVGSASLVVLALSGQHTAYFPTLFFAFGALGFGAGVSFMPMLNLAMRDIPPEDTGLASGLVNVSVQVAAAFGLAVLGSIAASRAHALRAGGHSYVDALTSGNQLALLIGAVSAACGALFAWRRL
jgi:EmrB/QacA subfamily drug resistance transporter